MSSYYIKLQAEPKEYTFKWATNKIKWFVFVKKKLPIPSVISSNIHQGLIALSALLNSSYMNCKTEWKIYQIRLMDPLLCIHLNHHELWEYQNLQINNSSKLL